MAPRRNELAHTRITNAYLTLWPAIVTPYRLSKSATSQLQTKARMLFKTAGAGADSRQQGSATASKHLTITSSDPRYVSPSQAPPFQSSNSVASRHFSPWPAQNCPSQFRAPFISAQLTQQLLSTPTFSIAPSSRPCLELLVNMSPTRITLLRSFV